MGDRSEGVGERDQIFPDLRRIVGLCNENRGNFDRSPTSAVDSSIIRQLPGIGFGSLVDWYSISLLSGNQTVVSGQHQVQSVMNGE